MNFKNLTFIVLTWSCFLVSCTMDGDENCNESAVEFPNEIEFIDGTAYMQSLLDCREPRVQTFEVSNIQGGQIMGQQGTTIFINPQAFTELGGEFIDGNVTVSLIEMYSPGEIITCQLSTNGINMEGNIEPLFSESIFYLDITYQGNPVIFLQPLRVFVPSNNLGIQQFLYASPSCPALECNVLWEEVISSVPVFEKPIVDPVGNATFGYQALVEDIGWKNIGRYNQNTNPRSTVYNKAPVGYNKTNANVFISYNTPSNAIGLFAQYDENLDVFTENFAQLPTNQVGDVIFVTVQDNAYQYSTKNITITTDLVTTTLNTTSTDETGLIQALNNL